MCLFGNLSVYTVKVPGTTDYLVQDKLHLKVVFLVKFGILSLRDETLDAGALSNQVFHSMDQWSPVSRMCLSMVESPAPLKRGSVSQKQLKTEAQDIAWFHPSSLLQYLPLSPRFFESTDCGYLEQGISSKHVTAMPGRSPLKNNLLWPQCRQALWALFPIASLPNIYIYIIELLGLSRAIALGDRIENGCAPPKKGPTSSPIYIDQMTTSIKKSEYFW